MRTHRLERIELFSLRLPTHLHDWRADSMLDSRFLR